MTDDPREAEHDDQAEADRVEEQTTPRAPVIYETVRRSGEEEMARPAMSLWWSGVAAGLSISFSVLAQAVLRTHLPDEPWRDLVTALGYPIGFLMVVLARQQLFTENTLTVVLPVMAEAELGKVGHAARLWAIVLAANLTGTFIAALFCTYTGVLDPEVPEAMLEISRHAMAHDFVEHRAARRHRRLPDGVDGLADPRRRVLAVPHRHRHDLPDRRQRLGAHRRRQHRGLPAPARRRDGHRASCSAASRCRRWPATSSAARCCSR